MKGFTVMPKTLKKLTAIFLSAAISILSAACSSEPENLVTTDDISVSAELTAETSEEAASDSSDNSGSTETKTTSPSSTSELAPITEDTTTPAESTTESVSETYSTAETSELASAETTEAVPETETAVTTASTPTETETAAPISATTAATTPKTETQTTPPETSVTTTTTAATEATTTASTTAETTAITTEPEASGSSFTLSNPNASKEAQKLYNYISDTYGKAIISGQQESTWMGSEQYEFDYIFEKTGKYPAIRGLDYMNDDFNGVNRRAAEWHDRGGIVTICWHCGCDFSGSWSECINTELKDWEQALTEGTEEYKTLIAGMDKAAKALKELKDKNIPVLWRPFHELDGGWFWWSKGGAENFKKLWIIMYDRYTNYWGLDNLIWVFGYSGNGVDYGSWYPGDDYVDIAGADSYSDGSNARLYKLVSRIVGEKKPICFHECGRIPTAEQLKTDKANWVWFMTWHTEHITNGNDVNDLKSIYNDSYVITLDELPDLR